MPLSDYHHAFSTLRMNPSTGRASPHKACMLLAVMDLIADNHITTNRIRYDQPLRQRFAQHFDRWRGPSDHSHAYYPFFHLKGSDGAEPFWHHQPLPGRHAAYRAMTTARSHSAIEDTIAYAYLDEELFVLLRHKPVRRYLAATLESRLQGESDRNPLASGRDWDWLECEAVVASYMSMLYKELAGERYSKKAHWEQLLPALRQRSKGAIEFKYGNISAILIEDGLPYVAGYKPAPNYQGQLRDVVALYTKRHALDLEQQFSRALDPPSDRVADAAAIYQADATDTNHFTDPPEREAEAKPPARPSFTPRKFDYPEREARNRRLGERGEAFVLHLEQQRLEQAGLTSLAREVEWTARDHGDGAGYDIRSFDPETEAPRHIEVKTTERGKYQPFIVTANELAFSQAHAETYQLYRVFEYAKKPKIFTLPGDLTDHVHLQAMQHRASFR